jgi:hypothetical protein
METSVLAAFAALALLSGAAPAHDPASGPSTAVSAVVVPGGPVPKIASSYPANGAAVPAGILTLKIVFDQPMGPDGWSYGRAQAGAFPKCLERPRLLADQHTFVLLCQVLPHQSYALEINVPKDFASEIGRSAKPTLLQFTTTDVGPRDMHDALQQADLTDADEPIMRWRDGGSGVSQSAPPEHEAEPANDPHP